LYVEVSHATQTTKISHARLHSLRVKRAWFNGHLPRPAYQQNDYIGWITRAKLEAIKQKRLNQMLEELKGGKYYMKMEWTK
jgi:hypothetical protein